MEKGMVGADDLVATWSYVDQETYWGTQARKAKQKKIQREARFKMQEDKYKRDKSKLKTHLEECELKQRTAGKHHRDDLTRIARSHGSVHVGKVPRLSKPTSTSTSTTSNLISAMAVEIFPITSSAPVEIGSPCQEPFPFVSTSSAPDEIESPCQEPFPFVSPVAPDKMVGFTDEFLEFADAIAQLGNDPSSVEHNESEEQDGDKTYDGNMG
jgi:hypothetical protein